ncbi:MAG: SDR family oxidoreductase [Balneolaceae bacterium]|nr:SDR family oxidoreductase [Balneolaceae bacterium]
MELTGKLVLVTGASRGIGRSISEKILDSGARVIGTARVSEFPQELGSHPGFEGIKVDLADMESIRERLKPVFRRERAPDVLVNNAGVFEPAGMESDEEAWLQNWNRTMEINLRIPALLSRWALHRWKAEGDGVLINIASRAAYRGDTQEFASYAASKGGMVAFTKSFARSFGRYGVAAYSIAPGFIDTDMARESIEIYGEEYLTEGMAFDEITSPEQVAEMVQFLASGRVKHMTGATFHINGGSYMI